MPNDPLASLPETLRSVKTRPLFVMRLAVGSVQRVGETPWSNRRVGVVTGGTFEGDRLSGAVLEGGSDWQTVRRDNATTLDVRLVLEIRGDGALIAMSYRGLRHGPAQIVQAIDRGESVDPASYYFRIIPIFETSSSKYDWLNRILAVGVGHREPTGPTYSVFEVL